MELDGWLQNQFYLNKPQRTVTITMDVRLAQWMKEHLPDEMSREDLPTTPYHPQLALLNREDPGRCYRRSRRSSPAA